MTDKLTAKEKKEAMYGTWGRIKARIEIGNDNRLKALTKKFDADMDNAHVEENYFNQK